MNYHSSTNQEILRKFVDRDVIMLASDIVSYIQEYNPDFGLDACNMSYLQCSICGGFMNVFEDVYTCDNCDHKTDEEPEYHDAEIYEYWFVTDWLADKLEAKNEVILHDFNTPIWGRQATGQAILLDNVIGEIAEDLEILEGQRYDWSVKN